MVGGPFDNPFILVSEHRRILASVYERADERVETANRYGFWRGVAGTAWVTVLIGCVGFAAGFMVGVVP
jgi:anti-sigma-K factor RskA